MVCRIRPEARTRIEVTFEASEITQIWDKDFQPKVGGRMDNFLRRIGKHITGLHYVINRKNTAPAPSKVFENKYLGLSGWKWETAGENCIH